MLSRGEIAPDCASVCAPKGPGARARRRRDVGGRHELIDEDCETTRRDCRTCACRATDAKILQGLGRIDNPSGRRRKHVLEPSPTITWGSPHGVPPPHVAAAVPPASVRGVSMSSNLWKRRAALLAGCAIVTIAAGLMLVPMSARRVRVRRRARMGASRRSGAGACRRRQTAGTAFGVAAAARATAMRRSSGGRLSMAQQAARRAVVPSSASLPARSSTATQHFQRRAVAIALEHGAGTSTAQISASLRHRAARRAASAVGERQLGAANGPAAASGGFSTAVGANSQANASNSIAIGGNQNAGAGNGAFVARARQISASLSATPLKCEIALALTPPTASH